MIKTALYTLIITLAIVGQVSANDYVFSANKGIIFSWEKKDKVGTYTVAGTRLYSEVTDVDSDPHTALLSFLGWSTKANTSYYAYAPYNTRYVSDGNKITALPLIFTGQKQCNNNDLSHLSAFDFMMGKYTTGDNSADIILQHLCSIIRIEWQMEDDRQLASITLSTDEPLFATKAEMNLPEQKVTATDRSKTITLLLDDIRPASGEPLTAYISLLPVDLTDKIISISLVTTDGIEHEASIRGTELQADKTYPVAISGQKADAKSQQTGKSQTSVASITNADTDINSITSGQRYVAYSPFTAVDEDKNVIHVTYRNQIQKESVNMDAYYKRSQSDEQMQAYLASEKEASAHLGKYDYMVSAATAPEHGNMSFKFTRLGSIVRFYLRIPAEGFYDSIQVINKDAAFILDADMDITKTNSSEAFTNPVTSHIVSLSFQKEKKEEGGNVSHSGFDLTDTPDNHYYGTPSSGRRGYIIAYMMFAPINLNTANIGKSTLYLLGHDKNGNKKYYRATDKLTKINIAQNKTQQWAPATLELDEPIDFVPVEVEIWKNDTNFDNDGTGTDDW